MYTASKRVIIREGVPVSVGAVVATQFDADYVVTGSLKTGDYHYRSYAMKVTHGEGGEENVILHVWHTKRSIIVALPPEIDADSAEEETEVHG